MYAYKVLVQLAPSDMLQHDASQQQQRLSCVFACLQEIGSWQQVEQGKDHIHQPAGNMVRTYAEILQTCAVLGQHAAAGQLACQLISSCCRQLQQQHLQQQQQHHNKQDTAHKVQLQAHAESACIYRRSCPLQGRYAAKSTTSSMRILASCMPSALSYVALFSM
jgi:hypothetical protein